MAEIRGTRVPSVGTLKACALSALSLILDEGALAGGRLGAHGYREGLLDICVGCASLFYRRRIRSKGHEEATARGPGSGLAIKQSNV